MKGKSKKQVQAQTPAPAREAYPYKTFIWLSACVFIKHDFVSELDKIGVMEMAKNCPLGNDLTENQAAMFEQAFSRWELRLLVKLWWLILDARRVSSRAPWL